MGIFLNTMILLMGIVGICLLYWLWSSVEEQWRDEDDRNIIFRTNNYVKINNDNISSIVMAILVIYTIISACLLVGAIVL